MTGDRARGVLLYALAAALLAAGGAWYVRSAPQLGQDPRLRAWRAAAERALPDVPLQTTSGTLVLSPGANTTAESPVNGGSYALTVTCAGVGQVRIRMSHGNSGSDSGRAVRCADEPAVQRLSVALADQFFMVVSSESTGDASSVLRWRLEPAPN